MNFGKDLNKLRPRGVLICQNPDHPAESSREYYGYLDSKSNYCSRWCRNKAARVANKNKITGEQSEKKL